VVEQNHVRNEPDQDRLDLVPQLVRRLHVRIFRLRYLASMRYFLSRDSSASLSVAA
jgi:hypothetical protein